MYCTVLVKPNDETWIADRLIDDISGDKPVAEQKVGNIQTKIITIVCATFADIGRIKQTLQEDLEWHHNVSDNTAPIQEGLNLFQGMITCQRFLPRDIRDSGEYLIDVEL